jgi:iron complex transport system permease protein
MQHTRDPFTAYYRKRTRASALILLFLTLALPPSFLLALVVGGASIPFKHVLTALLFPNENINGFTKTILFEVRVPRVLAAMLVGAGLAISGVVLQSLFRNPLAEPYLLGISAGASLGATLAVALGLYNKITSLFGPYFISSMAFLGSTATTLVIYFVGRSLGFKPLALLLLGVSISFILSGITALLQYLSLRDALMILTLLLGSFSATNWYHVQLLGVAVPVAVTLLLTKAKDLNTILLGEEYAKQLGVNLARLTQHLILITSILTAVSVAVAGIIGFVGIIVPHIARALVGYDHKFLIPSTTLLGSLILSLADTGAKALLRPSELPVGIITSLLGAPILVYILMRSGGRGAKSW